MIEGADQLMNHSLPSRSVEELGRGNVVFTAIILNLSLT